MIGFTTVQVIIILMSLASIVISAITIYVSLK